MTQPSDPRASLEGRNPSSPISQGWARSGRAGWAVKVRGLSSSSPLPLLWGTATVMGQ